MKNISNFINFLKPFLVLALLAKGAALVLSLFLPQMTLEKTANLEGNLPFKHYKSAYAFGFKDFESSPSIPSQMQEATDLILKAIYKKAEGGFVVVVDAKTKETIFLTKGEKYKEYSLHEIFAKHVLFLKDGRYFSLEMNENLALKENVDVLKKEEGSPKKKVSINKNDVLKYTKDFNAIWKNISIQEVKENGKITGFKVVGIQRKSIFGALGLRVNDIIIKVNGELLTSHSQAFKIYKDIQTYDYIVITVLRNGKEEDFSYEIK